MRSVLISLSSIEPFAFPNLKSRVISLFMTRPAAVDQDQVSGFMDNSIERFQRLDHGNFDRQMNPTGNIRLIASFRDQNAELECSQMLFEGQKLKKSP
jgi:hypothetical protein